MKIRSCQVDTQVEAVVCVYLELRAEALKPVARLGEMIGMEVVEPC